MDGNEIIGVRVKKIFAVYKKYIYDVFIGDEGDFLLKKKHITTSKNPNNY